MSWNKDLLTHIDARTQVKLYCADSALLIFSWLSLQQCVLYMCVCVCLIHTPPSCPGCWWRPLTVCWALGLHGLVDHCACSVFLTNTSLVSYVSVSLSLSSVSLTHSVVLISVLFSPLKLPKLILLTLLYLCFQTLRHFRIFWSSSVLGWWHGTRVASLSVPNVLVQSDSDPCFRMILTHSSNKLKSNGKKIHPWTHSFEYSLHWRVHI